METRPAAAFHSWLPASPSSLSRSPHLQSRSVWLPRTLVSPSFFWFAATFPLFFFLFFLLPLPPRPPPFPAILRHFHLLLLLPTILALTFSNPGSPKKGLACPVHLFQLSHSGHPQPPDECLWGRCEQLQLWVRRRVRRTSHPRGLRRAAALGLSCGCGRRSKPRVTHWTCASRG